MPRNYCLACNAAAFSSWRQFQNIESNKNKLNYRLNHKRRNPIHILCGLVLFLVSSVTQIRLSLVLSNQIPNSYMNTILEAYTSIHTTFLFVVSKTHNPLEYEIFCIEVKPSPQYFLLHFCQSCFSHTPWQGKVCIQFTPRFISYYAKFEDGFSV